MKVTKIRKTRESEIRVVVDDGKRKELPINTPLAFFNHMIETISWRGCINIGIKFKSTNFKLTHVITEDTGITLGKALLELIQKKIAKGINTQGCGIAALDEAMSICAVSVEGRSNCYIDLNDKKFYMKKAEDTLGADLMAFLEGLAQGMKATVNIRVMKGNDPHHLWESVFRALGDSLKMVFDKNAYRKNLIAGVKGVLD